MEWNNPKIAVVSGLFLLGAIIAYLVIPMSQENTIILTTPSGVTNSCANPNLVLAQNLTDLCDVTIISPSTNQILQYNGSQWVNVAQTTFNDTTTCTNVGSGTAFVCVEGSNVNLRSILAGSGITVSNDSNTITISASGSESTQCLDAVGFGSSLIYNSTSGNCYLKTIASGDSIDVNCGISFGRECVITNTAPDDTSCTNVGAGSQIYKDGECNFRTLTTGTGISLAQNTNDVQITNSAPESTVCTNLGTVGEGIYVSGNCNFKKLLAGSSISLSSNGTRITITNSSPESTSCTDATNPTGSGIVASSSGGNCTFKKLLAGTGISLSSNSTRITITNSLPEQGCTSAGGTTLLKTASTCDFKGLTAGSGISITSNTNDNAIGNTGVLSMTSADTNTLSYSASTGAITATPTLRKLCEVIATGGETTLTCTLSSSQQYIQINGGSSFDTGSTNTHRLRFNGDTGTNYAYRTSTNGAADATTTSNTGINIVNSGDSANRMTYFFITCQDVISSQEKTCYGNRTVGTATGGANAPSRIEYAIKWANTANDITSVSIERTGGSGVFEANNFLTVWGYS